MARVSTAPSGAMMAHSLYVLQTVGLRQTNCPTSSLAFGRLPTIPFLRNSNSAYARQGLRVIMTKRLPSVVSAAAAGEESEVAGLLEPPSGDSIDKEFQDSLQQDNATENDTELTDLKQGLVDSFYGTQRGLRANSDIRAEINELVTQLEAKNPTPVPTEALALLNGKWILAYTSNSELFPFLALGSLPLVKVGEISQTIDALAFTVENSVTFEGPLASTSLKAAASFEVRSPKRVQIKFEQGIIGTPQLTDSLDVPASVDVLGQTIDVKPIWGVLHPLQDAANSVARTISGQPPLKFPIQADRAQSWLLTTYLDEDLRISRGDGGSVFVLIKENSALLY